MWALVRCLERHGVTVILTTHYIEEAEEMADRIGVINKGELILVEDKAALMRNLGKKQLTLQLQKPLDVVPEALAGYRAGAGERTARADLHLRHAGRADRHHRAARRPGRGRNPLPRPADQGRARWRTSSSAW